MDRNEFQDRFRPCGFNFKFLFLIKHNIMDANEIPHILYRGKNEFQEKLRLWSFSFKSFFHYT